MNKESIKILLIWALFCLILFAYDYTHDKRFTAYIWIYGVIGRSYSKAKKMHSLFSQILN